MTGSWRNALVWIAIGMGLATVAIGQPASLSGEVSQRLTSIKERAPAALAQDASRDKLAAELDGLLAAMAVGGSQRVSPACCGRTARASN